MHDSLCTVFFVLQTRISSDMVKTEISLYALYYEYKYLYMADIEESQRSNTNKDKQIRVAHYEACIIKILHFSSRTEWQEWPLTLSNREKASKKKEAFNYFTLYKLTWSLKTELLLVLVAVASFCMKGSVFSFL